MSNRAGEFFYLRDEESGVFWSPTVSPARGVTPYSIRHGFGYTVFEHIEEGIASEFWIYVATDAPVLQPLGLLLDLTGEAMRSRNSRGSCLLSHRIMARPPSA